MPHSRSGPLLLFVALLANCAFLFSACSHTAPPNIVVIVLDTARPDRLSVYGDPRPTSPFLEEFARDATTFERAYSTSSWTLPAHASLFSGALPSVHHATQGHPRIEDAVPTLAERLTGAGYETAGFSNNPWVAEHTGLSRGFTRFVDKWDKRDRSNSDVAAHPTVQSVRAWLDETKADKKPFFLFVNLIEPHMPYVPPPAMAAPFFASEQEAAATANRYFKKGEGHALCDRHYAGTDPLSKDDWRALESLYAGELRYTDAITRALVVAAEARGGAANTLVFLVSDHGENLGDHGHIGHTFNLYDSNVHVALLAKGPGFAGGTRERKLVQLTDVFATAIGAAGLAADKHCVGTDLRAPIPSSRVLYASLDRPTISLDTFPEELRDSGALKRFDRSLEAVIGPRFKFIEGSDGSQEIYDLLADPGELHPLGPDEGAASFVTQARAVIEAVHATATGATDVELTQDPRVREALRSLGYAQ